jgi:GntR family transcriptional regulator
MTNKPNFSINLDNPIAVYVQIENQVEFSIARGRFKPGDTLPSVREMALMLKVNPNTVTKAYRDLELLGVVSTRRGVGVTVTEKAPRTCRESMYALAKSHLRDAVAECVAAGLNPSKIRAVTGETIFSGLKPYEAVKKC